MTKISQKIQMQTGNINIFRNHLTKQNQGEQQQLQFRNNEGLYYLNQIYLFPSYLVKFYPQFLQLTRNQLIDTEQQKNLRLQKLQELKRLRQNKNPEQNNTNNEKVNNYKFFEQNDSFFYDQKFLQIQIEQKVQQNQIVQSQLNKGQPNNILTQNVKINSDQLQKKIQEKNMAITQNQNQIKISNNIQNSSFAKASLQNSLDMGKKIQQNKIHQNQIEKQKNHENPKQPDILQNLKQDLLKNTLKPIEEQKKPQPQVSQPQILKAITEIKNQNPTSQDQFKNQEIINTIQDQKIAEQDVQQEAVQTMQKEQLIPKIIEQQLLQNEHKIEKEVKSIDLETIKQQDYSEKIPTLSCKRNIKMFQKNQERIKILLDQLKEVIQVIEQTLPDETVEQLRREQVARQRRYTTKQRLDKIIEFYSKNNIQ